MNFGVGGEKTYSFIFTLVLFFGCQFSFSQGGTEIYYDVPIYEQDCDYYCWAASILMVRDYYERESKYSQSDIAELTRPKLPKEVIDCDTGINDEDFKKVLDYWGFEVYPNACFEPDGWYDLLKSKGPLIISLFSFIEVEEKVDKKKKRIEEAEEYLMTHCVVLKGMSERSLDATMYVNDPWKGKEIKYSYLAFEKKFELTATLGEAAGVEKPYDKIQIVYYSPLFKRTNKKMK